MPGALIWREQVTAQRKRRAREGEKKERIREREKEKKKQGEEQNAMNYRKRQKRPGLAS